MDLDDQRYIIGIDIGTSACRACAINANADIVARFRLDLPAPVRTAEGVQQEPAVWWQALCASLQALCTRIDPRQVERMAVDGTSATLLLCRPDGTCPRTSRRSMTRLLTLTWRR